MVLETERLELIPLTARQLKLWLEDVQTLEDELQCKYCAEPLEGFFHEIVRGQLAKTENNPDHYLYHSFWFIIRKADRVVVGSCDFKNVPNSNHEVEIGYGLGNEFEGSGYMTEAIREFCKWALTQKEITHVIAETENGNLKSENVLKRVGFIQWESAFLKDDSLYQDKDSTWWRL